MFMGRLPCYMGLWCNGSIVVSKTTDWSSNLHNHRQHLKEQIMKKKKMQVKYIVKPEDGVVVCILSDTTYDVMVDMKLPLDFFNTDMAEMFEIRDEFKGVARLAVEDTWDEERGKQIAYLKAYKKYLNAKAKVVTRLADELYVMADLFNSYAVQYGMECKLKD